MQVIRPDGTLELKRIFSATQERLFRAWTNPKEIAEWWENMDHANLDVRVGGRREYVFLRRDGSLHRQIGKFLEIDPPNKIVFTWTPFGTSFETKVTVQFISRGKNRTELVLTHEGIPTEEIRIDHNGGWNHALDCLSRAHLEDE